MNEQEQAVGRTVGAVLGGIARTLQSEPDVESTLAAIVKGAVDHVGGAEYAGISLVERGRKVRTVAPTDGLVATIDEVQYRTGQGPCLDAIAEHQVFRISDLTTEKRWPTFTSKAAAIGVRSMLSFRLFVSETTLGSLNLYARARDVFDDQAADDGLMFATHAAIALAGAQTEERLHVALERRDVIGTAKGILMQRHNVDAVQAFAMLVDASQATNVKLYEVALWLVGHRGEV
ncbi:GAF and ANTAR domain-containing protein [Amycolatopsis sp. lyj-84]|uniref:GAF and ANTAR domain-containing protein n=1 Tax=Amycolatopsis sp. lyj-84 TaxID=2789284 RepID=UPI00397E8CB4